ncbi:MFS transporter [Ktedonobacter sp. SOSP1-85]|uniref:MFS transporter n=1 Tax=Ktedonobacter sp. SOSP1-85 TaxID=2778367 RepID=UPI0019161AA4|nr:MFS transporter [Ktedonobacter sp. SOSP1-85]GHO81900.1 MFS transporter [Ktedonobacter sp. SOSP1-85]
MDKKREKDPTKRFPWLHVRTLGLIVFVGINLRTALLAVPPIVPLLSHDLHLTYTQTGLLTSLPTLVMGVVSLPIGLLIGRWGGRIMVAFGLLLVALGASLRALWPAVLPLYFFTALLSLGSACSQTAIPALIRQWFSTRIGLATALYSDGLVIGETLGAMLTIPVMLNWFGRDTWTGTFVFWSVPVVIALVLWLWLAPANTVNQRSWTFKQARPTPHRSSRRFVPVNPWTLGLFVGGAQLIYFGTNAWIASYNQAVHAPALTWLALGVLNAAQFPASLFATLFAHKLVGRKLPFIICASLCLIALVCWIWTPVILEPLWAAVIGGTTILLYTLAIALPALLAKQEEVAQWTGTMLTVGYLFSFLGSFIGGWLWDMVHIPAIAFLPLALASGVVLVLGVLLPIQQPPAHRASHRVGGESPELRID